MAALQTQLHPAKPALVVVVKVVTLTKPVAELAELVVRVLLSYAILQHTLAPAVKPNTQLRVHTRGLRQLVLLVYA
jgi:hypothetical protein